MLCPLRSSRRYDCDLWPFAACHSLSYSSPAQPNKAINVMIVVSLCLFLCSMFLLRLGVAPLVGCLSHTCCPFNHHAAAFSLLAAWLFPLITVVFMAEKLVLPHVIFLLLLYLLIISQSMCNLRAAAHSATQPPARYHATRQNTSVDLPVSHSPVPPPQPQSPSTVSPGDTIYCANRLSISLQPIHPSNLINSFKPWCPLLGPKYKTLK